MTPPVLWSLSHPLDPLRFGSKAARLADLRARGAAVPPSWVLPADQHADALQRPEPTLTEAAAAQILEALPALGPPPWAVRTSAPTEDLPQGSAAGLYRTELGLTTPAAVLDAIHRCWEASAVEPVRRYLEALGVAGDPPPVALLLQRQVAARWAGVLFTRDPREGPQSAHRYCELSEASPSAVTAGLVAPKTFVLHPDGTCRPPLPDAGGVTPAHLGQLATRAEAVVQGPADVELAFTDEGLVALQVRPITAWTAPAPTVDADGLHWQPDLEHNPTPLSPLHASLVARLDRIPTLPFRLRCFDGLLYTASRPDVAPHRADDAAATAADWPARRLQLEDEVAALEDLAQTPRPEDPVPLPVLLDRFDHFYERYARLAGVPLARAAHSLAVELAQRYATADPAAADLADDLADVGSPLSQALIGLAHRLRERRAALQRWSAGQEATTVGGADLESDLAQVVQRLGALPPVWDLASPTLAEAPPDLLRRAAASLALSANPLPPAAATPADPRLRDLQADEEDDLLFARALAVLRHACLQAGRRLQQAGRLDHAHQVFGLRLPTLLHALEGKDPQVDLRPAPTPPSAGRPPGTRPLAPLRGHGCGGDPVSAPAFLIDPAMLRDAHRLTTLVDDCRDHVVVCATLVPAAAVLLTGARGVVTDHGGQLSHGAILARELGLPAVLGTRYATALLRTGQPVWLDPGRGTVIPLE